MREDYFEVRMAIAALAAILVALGAATGTIGAIIGGGFILVALAGERVIAVPTEKRNPGVDFHPTDEKFIDPVSAKPVQVYFNPNTGERRYIALPTPHQVHHRD